jgi:hypothetical protein
MESGYFILGREISKATARVSDPVGLPRRASLWISGARLEVAVPIPVVYKIEEGDEGEMGAYFNTAAPLMSRELVDTLQGAGVDNLETYDAVIREESSGREYREYRAANVIGLIAMADASRSSTESLEGLGTWVHKLVVDERTTRGALLFRLREGPSKIVVHRSIKEAIEAKNLPLLQFMAVEQFVG